MGTSHFVFYILGLLWFVGIFVSLTHCRKMASSPISSSLPFEDPDNPPLPYRLGYAFFVVSLMVTLIGGLGFLPLGFTEIQSLVFQRDDPIAQSMGESILILFFPCMFLTMGLWLLAYQKVVKYFPGHEKYHVFQGAKSPPKLLTLAHQKLIRRFPELTKYRVFQETPLPNWDVETLNYFVRKQRTRTAKWMVWTWLLVFPVIILSFDCYVRVTSTGLQVNPFWGINEKNYDWRQLQSATLYGKLSLSQGGCDFYPQFRVLTPDGQEIKFLGQGQLIPPTPLESIITTAAALRRNHVLVTVRALNSRQDKCLSSDPGWQKQIRKLWRDVSALPGVQIKPSDSQKP